jgi:hypothetical protein
MIRLMQRGIEMVGKTHFIDGHVIFHAFPIDAGMKWIKACGILSVFIPDTDLGTHQGMWGILPKKAPARSALLQEKESAVHIADECLEELRSMRNLLPAEDYRILENAWENAVAVTRLVRNWCRCICAYLDDLQNLRPDHPNLDKAISASRPDFERVTPTQLRFGAPTVEAAVRMLNCCSAMSALLR